MLYLIILPLVMAAALAEGLWLSRTRAKRYDWKAWACSLADLAGRRLLALIPYTFAAPWLGWLEYVFNTPSSHRVHHARNPEYLDANFGGVLIVFDRMFGSYVEERAGLACDYGLVSPTTSSRNPLVLNVQPWIGLAKDVAS